MGEVCFIWGEESNDDDSGNGSQHWIGKICYFWECDETPEELYCCVRWMCQPCFTPLRSMRNPSEIFSTDQFCHDVNICTIEWNSKRGAIATVQVQYFADPLVAEEQFDYSKHDFFYCRKVHGNMGDPVTCPSWSARRPTAPRRSRRRCCSRGRGSRARRRPPRPTRPPPPQWS